MDRSVNSALAYPHLGAGGGMPPEARLSMPSQDLRYKPSQRTREPAGAAGLYARFIFVAVTLGVSTYGVYQMLHGVRFARMTPLQGVVIFFFALSLGRLALAPGAVITGA